MTAERPVRVFANLYGNAAALTDAAERGLDIVPPDETLAPPRANCVGAFLHLDEIPALIEHGVEVHVLKTESQLFPPVPVIDDAAAWLSAVTGREY